MARTLWQESTASILSVHKKPNKGSLRSPDQKVASATAEPLGLRKAPNHLSRSASDVGRTELLWAHRRQARLPHQPAGRGHKRLRILTGYKRCREQRTGSGRREDTSLGRVRYESAIRAEGARGVGVRRAHDYHLPRITYQEVDDELFSRLRRFFDEDALVELTATIAWENSSSKFNWALRIPSQCLWRGSETR